MKALTLWQPWASLMARGFKEIETRGWSTSYRGPVMIHAAQRMRQDQLLLQREPEFHDFLECVGAKTMHDLPLGCVVAVGHLTECAPAHALLEHRRDEGSPFHDEDLFGDFGTGRFGWLFEWITPLPLPVTFPGQQGLWTPPRELISEVSAGMGVMAR